MISSGEIAAQFAAQNQYFLQQNQYAQQIGVAPPGSLAQMGTPGMVQNHAGAPVFNYGAGIASSGYGGGNRFASSIMSGIGTGATLGGAALGIASQFGPLQALNAFNPIGAFGMARAAGMGMAGSMGVAALPLAAGMAIQHGISSFVGGAQGQSTINTSLGQHYNFFNPASRSGQGFSRDDAMAVGNTVRSLAFMPEMMSSVDELTRIMGRMKQSGAMQGVRDVAEFQRRFKESLDVIKSTAQMLGTTMEEAQAFFSHSRSVGFYNKTDQLKNALNAQLTSGLTGMSMGQVMQLQAGGAGMATAMGARRSLGTKAVTNIAQQIGMAQQTGTLQDGLLEDITGLQGPEAVQAGAQQMAGLMTKMFQSPAGQLVAAGLVKYKNGKAIGIDEDLAKRFNSGGISMNELRSRAMGLSEAEKISFKARAADLGMSFAGSVGPGGMGRFINEIAGGRYGSEGANLIMQRYGATANEADLAMQLSSEGLGNSQSQMATQMSREAEIQNNSPRALFQRIKTRLHAATFGKIEQAGAQAFNSLSKSYDEFIDDVVGRHVVTLSKRGADALSRAMSGGNKKELQDMFAAASGLKVDYNGTVAPGGFSVGSLAKGAAYSLTAPFGGAGLLAQSGLGDSIKNAVDRSGFGGSIAETHAMEFIRGLSDPTTTGRSALGQARYMQGILGAKDLDSLSGRLHGIAGTRLSAGLEGTARDVFGNLRASMGMDYEKADEAKRHEMLRGGFLESVNSQVRKGQGFLGSELSALSGALSYETLGAVKLGITSTDDLMSLSGDRLKSLSSQNRAIVQEMQRRVKSGAAKNAEEAFLQVTAGAGALNVNKLAGVTEAKNILTAGGRDQAIRNATDVLKSAGLDEGTIGIIQSNPTMQDAISQAFGNSAVRDILSGDMIRDDPDMAIKELAKHGIHLDAKDLPTLKEAWTKVASGDSGKILGAMQNFKAAKSSGDISIMQQAFGKNAAQIQESISKGHRLTDKSKAILTGLSKAYAAFSDTRDVTKTQSNFEAARTALSHAQQEFLKLGSSQRAEVIAAAGSSAGAFMRADAIDKLRGKSMSAQDIADRLGIRGDDALAAIENSGVAGTGHTKTKLTDKVISKLIENLGGQAAAKGEAQVGQQLDTSKDKLNSTLDDLNGSLKMMNDTNGKIATVLVASISDDAFKKGQERLKQLQGSSKPADTEPVKGGG